MKRPKSNASRCRKLKVRQDRQQRRTMRLRPREKARARANVLLAHFRGGGSIRAFDNGLAPESIFAGLSGVNAGKRLLIRVATSMGAFSSADVRDVRAIPKPARQSRGAR